MKQCILIFYPGVSPYVGIWQPNKPESWYTVAVETPSPSGNSLFTALTNLFEIKKVSSRDITHIGVMPGPASYTQLRSFIAAANSMAWALHVPLFAIGQNDSLPDTIPSLVVQAQINRPIEPIYPTTIG